MGRANHPRDRHARKIERKKPSIAPYDRILIVTEGEKTEPQYLQEICSYYKLNTANIKITHCEYGTAPQQIITFAVDEFKKTRGYDRVFCVFDRDEHLSFADAVATAKSKNKKLRNDSRTPIEFHAVPSNPCFELWLLIHFEQCARLMHRADISARLRTAGYIPNYTKAHQGLFNTTRDLLATAYLNAEFLAAQRARHGNDTPYTELNVLVKLLTTLKK